MPTDKSDLKDYEEESRPFDETMRLLLQAKPQHQEAKKPKQASPKKPSKQKPKE